MKAYGGYGGIAPVSRNLGTRWEWSAERPDHFNPGVMAVDAK